MPVPPPSWPGVPHQWDLPVPPRDPRRSGDEPDQAEDGPLDLRVVALVVGVMVMALLVVFPVLAADVAGRPIAVTAE